LADRNTLAAEKEIAATLDEVFLRLDMDRMNGALVNKDDKSKELANTNQMMETEFVAKLKEIEKSGKFVSCH